MTGGGNSHRLISTLQGCIRICDHVNTALGRVATGLVLPLVLIGAAITLGRYLFGFSRVWMQELFVWIHAAIFMLGAGWVLMRDRHVRVDLFYAHWSAKRRAWVNLCGTLVFLLPWMAALLWWGWDFFHDSLINNESSGQPNGLPWLWLVKGMIPLAAFLVSIQGMAVIARAWLVLLDAPFPSHETEAQT